ncbi:MAG: hypothetical protein QOG66_1979 [Methylobacteriaceae bacterium]|jgi:hypothetical protein|nr:hypothetical protein [Methylobacteriaceae bacterium]
MRKLILLGGLALLATPAFAQFEGGVNGLGDARQINMPTSQLWGGGQPQAAPAAAAEEDEAPAPVAPVKTKKKTARH